MIKKRILSVAILVAAFSVFSSAANAVDIFVSADGVKGESTSRNYRDKIEVDSFNFEIKTSTTQSPAKGATKSTFPAFKISKTFDLSSNTLLASLTTGKTIKTMTVDFVKRDAQGAEFVFLRHTFSDVSGSEYSYVVNKESEDQGTEIFGFVYSKINTEYLYLDSAGKKASGPKFSFDVAANKLL